MHLTNEDVFFFIQDQLAQDPSAIDMFITGRALAFVYSSIEYFDCFYMSDEIDINHFTGHNTR